MVKNQILVEKTIVKVMIADDRKAIKFITKKQEIIAKTYGDCCSLTWIEHVELPVNGFPALVISVQDLDLEIKDPSELRIGEVIAYYGCKISTDKGDIIIDYRNESNGYYGGNIAWPGNYFYKGVYDQNISAENWVDLNESI